MTTAMDRKSPQMIRDTRVYRYKVSNNSKVSMRCITRMFSKNITA